MISRQGECIDRNSVVCGGNKSSEGRVIMQGYVEVQS